MRVTTKDYKGYRGLRFWGCGLRVESVAITHGGLGAGQGTFGQCVGTGGARGVEVYGRSNEMTQKRVRRRLLTHFPYSKAKLSMYCQS